MIRFPKIIAAMILLSPGIVIAGDVDGAARCAKLTTDNVRLACYDTIFGKPVAAVTPAPAKPAPAKPAPAKPVTAASPEKPSVPGATNWKVETTTSKVDDSQKVFLINKALETVAGPYGGRVRITLMAACRENSTNAWVNFGGFHMSDYQHGTVTYRVDSAPAKHKKFRESNDHKALGLWSGRGAIPFLKELLGHDTLYVRASPYSESAVEAEFDISGLSDVIGPLRTACNW